jgi:hypothetical protein
MAKILQRNREEIDPAGACVEPSGSKKELPQALMGGTGEIDQE